MTEPELEKVVQDVFRRYAGGQAMRMDARFAEDLRMSEMSRQMVFSQLAEAFSARGVSLPSRGFYLRDFLTCSTAADVLATIVSKVMSAPKARSAHAAHATEEKKASEQSTVPAAVVHAEVAAPGQKQAAGVAPAEALTLEPTPVQPAPAQTASVEPAMMERRPGTMVPTAPVLIEPSAALTDNVSSAKPLVRPSNAYEAPVEASYGKAHVQQIPGGNVSIGTPPQESAPATTAPVTPAYESSTPDESAADPDGKKATAKAAKKPKAPAKKRAAAAGGAPKKPATRKPSATRGGKKASAADLTITQSPVPGPGGAASLLDDSHGDSFLP